MCEEFTKRMDLPVSLHISNLEYGYEAAERGACTVFNVACVAGGPTHIRAESSHLYPPEAPGLGVGLDEDKLKALTVASA